MSDRQNNPEILFLEHLGWINRVAAMTCSKHGVWGAEAEDFVSFIGIKLMDDDYRVFRKFRAESGLKTYLATVVVRQFHDYWRERRGRWRPSAAARRLGPPAGELEALVYRDRYRLEQAGEKLRTAGQTTLSDTELGRLLEKLPARTPLRPVEVPPEAVIDTAVGIYRADERVVAAEAEGLRGRVMGALDRAEAQLAPEERMIVRMHFVDGYSVADVARTLGLEQKPLYRRVERLRAQLRRYMEADGVHDADVHGIFWEQGAP
jgi:RNA polymerase sigma factor (sigma-70 family)